MRNIRILSCEIYSFLCIIFALLTAYIPSSYCEHPYIPDIRSVIEKADMGEVSKNHGISRGLLPGQVFWAKNRAPVPECADGIYQFIIRSSDKQKYQFGNLSFLKEKKACLHLMIGQDVKNADIVLPEIDTVIEGNHLDNFSFILGAGATNNDANYYFLGRTNNSKNKIHIKGQGKIYAAVPENFNIIPGASITKVSPIKIADFFVKHTIGQKKIATSKEQIKNALNPRDDHSRPAKANQLRQILEYVIGRENSVKYFTVEAATGSGKTNTMLRLAELLAPKKVLIATPRLNLVQQIKKEAELYYPHLKIADRTDSHQNLSKTILDKFDGDVFIITLQGFEKIHADEAILSKFDTVIFDEAHNLLSPKRSEMVSLLKRHGNHRLELFFFTATPTLLHEHNESALKSAYQLSDEYNLFAPHITPFQIFDAINSHVNAPFQIIHVTNLVNPDERWEVGNEFTKTRVSENIAKDKFYR